MWKNTERHGLTWRRRRKVKSNATILPFKFRVSHVRWVYVRVGVSSPAVTEQRVLSGTGCGGDGGWAAEAPGSPAAACSSFARSSEDTQKSDGVTLLG